MYIAVPTIKFVPIIASPFTSNFLPGTVVPTPILPDCVIVKSEAPVLEAMVNGFCPAFPCTVNVEAEVVVPTDTVSNAVFANSTGYDDVPTFKLPHTSSFADGEVVPIPTYPLPRIDILVLP